MSSNDDGCACNKFAKSISEEVLRGKSGEGAVRKDSWLLIGHPM